MRHSVAYALQTKGAHQLADVSMQVLKSLVPCIHRMPNKGQKHKRRVRDILEDLLPVHALSWSDSGNTYEMNCRLPTCKPDTLMQILCRCSFIVHLWMKRDNRASVYMTNEMNRK